MGFFVQLSLTMDKLATNILYFWNEKWMKKNYNQNETKHKNTHEKKTNPNPRKYCDEAFSS